MKVTRSRRDRKTKQSRRTMLQHATKYCPRIVHIVLEAGEFNINLPVCLVSSEGPLFIVDLFKVSSHG
jgi:hypothetical protein